MVGRQWQGNGRSRRASDDDEDEEEESSIQSSRDRSSNGGDGKKGSYGPPPTYDGSREPGVFEEYRGRARLWLFSTNVESRARGPRLMQALSGKAFESVRHLIDDNSWLEASDNGEQLVELLAKPEYYGKEELESLYHAMHKLFYSELRRDEDDLPSFRSRFEQAVRKVKKHRVDLPQEALGFLFLRQAKISGESIERLVTLTNGDLKLDAVVDGLRKLKMNLMDCDEKSSSKKRHLWVAETVKECDDEMIDEPNEPHHDDDIDAIEQALAELDGEDSQQSVTEDDAKEILMTLIKQKITKPTTMSYKQVQQQKREVKNARGYRPIVSNSSGSGMRRDLQQLKAVTKCKNCGEMGHWHRECPHKKVQGVNQGQNTNASASQSSNHSWWSLVQPVGSCDSHPSEEVSSSLQPGAHDSHAE